MTFVIKVYLSLEPLCVRSLLEYVGVDLLSQVIDRTPSDKLNRQAGGFYLCRSSHLYVLIYALVRVLTTFMCDKLDDTETIIPALKALKALVSKDAFVASEAVDVSKA